MSTAGAYTAIHLVCLVYGILMGSALASYGCVIAERLPRGEALSRRSRCACGRQLQAVEIVPIFGWLLCRGRARCCGVRVPRSFLIAELLAGVVGGAAAGVGAVVATRGAPLLGAAIGVVGLASCLVVTVALRWPPRVNDRPQQPDPAEDAVGVPPRSTQTPSRRAHLGRAWPARPHPGAAEEKTTENQSHQRVSGHLPHVEMATGPPPSVGGTP